MWHVLVRKGVNDEMMISVKHLTSLTLYFDARLSTPTYPHIDVLGWRC